MKNIVFGFGFRARTEGTSDSDAMTSFSAAAIKCNFPPGAEVSPCRPWERACLFDLINDPCETNNIAASNPVLVNLLAQKVALYNQTAMPSVTRPFDALSDPANWGDIWAPWLDDSQILDPIPAFSTLNWITLPIFFFHFLHFEDKILNFSKNSRVFSKIFPRFSKNSRFFSKDFPRFL